MNTFAASHYPIVLEDVSKAYRLYARPSDRLKELILRRPFHKAFWALKGISLEVEKGKTFGLIGENGAGKSTLLKPMAGTIRPTSGIIKIEGRVSALLDLGSGFHPELSGRENVFLQAALLGFSQHETEVLYPQIAEFAELDKSILARPVKTYSSGMFVRLGFAVATSVSPDVLLVDEALSVGDMHFQKKSLDRMMGFRKSGKTVLFCSHNMYQVRSLCQRALWLRDGNMEAIGDTEEVVAAYEAYQLKKESPEEVDAESELVLDNLLPAEPGSSSPVRLISMAVLDHNGKETTRLETQSDSSVAIEVEVVQPGIPFHLALVVQRNDNINLFFTTTAADGMPPISAKKSARAVLSLPGFPLLSGDYKLCVYVLDDHAIQVYDMAEGICPFTMRSNPSEMGIVTLPHHWHVESDEADHE